MTIFDPKHLIESITNELNSEKNFIANLANISSMIMNSYDNLNWVGFYLVEGEELVVGPFQGKPACSRIKKGIGVCGEAFLLKKTLIVDNVMLRQNHIFCDPNSKSEIVIPLIHKNTCIGVLDIDSDMLNRFNDINMVSDLKEIVKQITNHI